MIVNTFLLHIYIYIQKHILCYRYINKSNKMNKSILYIYTHSKLNSSMISLCLTTGSCLVGVTWMILCKLGWRKEVLMHLPSAVTLPQKHRSWQQTNDDLTWKKEVTWENQYGPSAFQNSNPPERANHHCMRQKKSQV